MTTQLILFEAIAVNALFEKKYIEVVVATTLSTGFKLLP